VEGKGKGKGRKRGRHKSSNKENRLTEEGRETECLAACASSAQVPATLHLATGTISTSLNLVCSPPLPPHLCTAASNSPQHKSEVQV
jgi:hypothetical protein